MAKNDSATDGRTETKRFDAEFGLDEVKEGDRIDPALVPHSPHIDVGEPVTSHQTRLDDPEDDRTFGVRLIAGSEDSWGDVQTALVYDPETDLFARLSGHTSSGAMNQAERDWKVRDVGRDVFVVDAWDINVPDLGEFDQDEREFVEEWVEIAFDNGRYGDDINELVAFDGKKFTFRDHDGREAHVQYTLE